MGLYPLLSGLDSTLERLAEGAREALGDGFGGAYLHGSLARGVGDSSSDVDFVVLTARELTPADEARVQAFHAHLFATGPAPWAQRLDGSYAPAECFRRVDPERRPFLYLNNGASQLVPDPHCNTALIRYLVREHGVALAGPDARTLVDPVEADALRAEARGAMAEYAEWAELEGAGFSRWDQAYLVLTVCRLLYTAATGAVAGKPQAAAWATRELESRWHPLVQRAIADRGDPELLSRHPADPRLLAKTLDFVADARGRLAER